jgi:hypothetical protein
MLFTTFATGAKEIPLLVGAAGTATPELTH